MPAAQSDALRAIAARVRALLSKTTEAGATEAEALSAATKARELMDKYQLSLSDTELEAEGASRVNIEADSRVQFSIQQNLAMRVAAYCDCRVWQSGGKGLNFFGLQSDSAFASFLCVSLAGFVQRSAVEWALRAEGAGDQRGFMAGAESRINQRLRELTAARQQQDASQALSASGRSLIVVKNAIVEREFAKLGLSLGKSRVGRGAVTDSGAYSAGRAAGDRASFGRPISGQSGPKLLTTSRS